MVRMWGRSQLGKTAPAVSSVSQGEERPVPSRTQSRRNRRKRAFTDSSSSASLEWIDLKEGEAPLAAVPVISQQDEDMLLARRLSSSPPRPPVHLIGSQTGPWAARFTLWAARTTSLSPSARWRPSSAASLVRGGQIHFDGCQDYQSGGTVPLNQVGRPSFHDSMPSSIPGWWRHS
jgi:hypothetical protein